MMVLLEIEWPEFYFEQFACADDNLPVVTTSARQVVTVKVVVTAGPARQRLLPPAA